MTVTEDEGVRIVGATTDTVDTTTDKTARDAAHDDADSRPRRTAPRRRGGDRPAPTRRAFRLVSVVAVAGLVGTLVFGVLFASKSSGGPTQDPAVISASRAFLTDFFNFNAKTVDSDFNAVTAMATGAFSNQASQFFNTSIRKALEQALAESRGQIRALYVQSENEGAGTASIYAVVDQTYVNNKINTPQADVVRLTATLQRVGGVWKISDVTVLEGASPSSVGSPSGSSGSSVPGQ
ncbi:MAG TPA: hypothetical protein VMF35_12635 [Acidimicrobiales bacterium]|nr:hypothetical protein [Acidimicrobiales bacterium]